MLISMEISVVVGIKLFNYTKQVNEPKAKYTLQLVKCLFKDVNLHVTNCSYKCETLERIKVIQERHN